METEEYNCPDVVITAGGTREYVDDVRYLGNFSGGKLGHALASTYAELGQRVLLLAPNCVLERHGEINGVEHQPYTSAADLQAELLAVPAARLVLHGAAVSDYTPDKLEGKISSNEEELVIRCRRTPKILPQLREHYGPRAKIVGFKLLSNVAETELIDVATQQIATCQTDACIANDLQELLDTRRLHIVAPDGSYQTVQGDTRAVAEQIAVALPIEQEASRV